MLGASRKRDGKGIRVSQASYGVPTTVMPVSPRDAVDPGHTFRQVSLGGVFEVGHPSFVHLLGDPAFVADVAVAATLVQCREDPLDLGRAAAHGRKPRTLATVSVDVGHRISRADFW
jgi:hypothetical protein